MGQLCLKVVVSRMRHTKSTSEWNTQSTEKGFEWLPRDHIHLLVSTCGVTSRLHIFPNALASGEQLGCSRARLGLTARMFSKRCLNNAEYAEYVSCIWLVSTASFLSLFLAGTEVEPHVAS
jgi:hypothetical protein